MSCRACLVHCKHAEGGQYLSCALLRSVNAPSQRAVPKTLRGNLSRLRMSAHVLLLVLSHPPALCLTGHFFCAPGQRDCIHERSGMLLPLPKTSCPTWQPQQLSELFQRVWGACLRHGGDGTSRGGNHDASVAVGGGPPGRPCVLLSLHPFQ